MALVGCANEAADRVGGSEDAIVDGELDTKDPAVVALNIASTGFAVCTGTLVTPTAVLTAGHCPIDRVWVRQGTRVRSLGWTDHVGVQASARHPGYTAEGGHYDIALIRLDHPLDGIAPVVLSETPLSSADVGATVRHVGFGTTGDDWRYVKQIGSGGIKREVSYPITKVDDFFLWSGAPGKQTCLFDSGGPALRMVNGVERLIGIVSTGDDCHSDGGDTRVDRADVLSWIDAQLAEWNTARPATPKQ